MLSIPTPARAQTAEYFGPTPYLSAADIPAGFYGAGAPTALEDFEDGSLDFGILVSGGEVSPPRFPDNVDSVDADDGEIDGSGSDGHSWFIGDLGGFAELTFTFPTAPQTAGVVWTDGAPAHEVVFEAFGPGMVSLGVHGPFQLADGSNSGQTAEDRFFGARDPGGILAIRIANLGAVGGLEVDHVQFGQRLSDPVPGLSTLARLVLLAALIAVGAALRPAGPY